MTATGPTFDLPGAAAAASTSGNGSPASPVDDEIIRAPRTTAYDELRSELAPGSADTTITLEVPSRPGWAVRYDWSPAAEYEQVQAWWDRAKSREMPGGVNQAQAMALTLVNTCQAVLRHGQVVEFDGAPASFTSKTFRELLSTDDRPVLTASEAVRALYGSDGHVIAAGTKVLEKAGYGADILEGESDPTSG